MVTLLPLGWTRSRMEQWTEALQCLIWFDQKTAVRNENWKTSLRDTLAIVWEREQDDIIICSCSQEAVSDLYW